MAHRSTGSMTPGRPRKLPPATTNSLMPFADQNDYCDAVEGDIDESM